MATPVILFAPSGKSASEWCNFDHSLLLVHTKITTITFGRNYKNARRWSPAQRLAFLIKKSLFERS